METNITLTDDEISIIQTALEMNIRAIGKYVHENGEYSIDSATRSAWGEMKELAKRLEEI